jgi:hypothetical protein
MTQHPKTTFGGARKSSCFVFKLTRGGRRKKRFHGNRRPMEHLSRRATPF